MVVSLEKGDWLCTAAQTPRTLACRCLRHQCARHVLLPDHRAGWLQPLHRALGATGVDEGSGDRTRAAKALEKFPGVKPRVISDNGPQFLARDFKEFIRLVGATHVRTSPYYPQSNGKLERWHGSLKRECIRPSCPGSLEEARQRIAGFVEHYNTVRLHASLGYLTPADKLAGLDAVIFAERDRKLEEARQRRQHTRLAAREVAG